MKNKKRVLSDINPAGYDSVLNIPYNVMAGANKTVPLLGYLIPLGDASATAKIFKQPGQYLALYNNSAVTAFVAIAPTIALLPALTLATAIALPPNQYTIISMGPNSAYQTSAITVGCYELDDDTYVKDEQ